MTRVVVLGGGMIGSAVAFDLARDSGFDVTVADVSRERLAAVGTRTGAATVESDLSRPDDVRRLVARYDLVVGALPSVVGFQTVRAVIEAGRPCVDISFMPEDVLALDEAARAKGVTVVADCGIAPGISNMMVGHAAAQLTTCDRVDICVGGLPRERRWPFEYKAGFAPSDVIEEYVRPSRVVENGCVVVKPALSEVELIDIDGVGTLEAFITDGLRSLAHTVRADAMQERTLRYPGHANLMRVLRESGFFSHDAVDVGGQRVRPIDLTSALLFPAWTYADGEADLTAMRVVVEGRAGEENRRYEWNVLDFYDPHTRFRSMSRTTGFSAAIVARLVGRGAFVRPGVCAPEAIGAQSGMLADVLRELRSRGVRVI
jgi:saccharopine dehydrogenase-like NADP-dependent oxidoreductase